MELTRRRLLAAGTTAASVAVAGCSGGCGGLPFVGTGMPNDGEVAAEPAESVPGGATVLVHADLPAAEQSLLRTAVEEGVARACMDGGSERADALRSVADRVSVESSYLAYDGDRYALWVRVTDVVHAGTADPPEGDADPCC